MNLNRDDVMYVKGVYEDFYGQLNDVSDYMRIKKQEALSQLPAQLFTHADDYFDAYDMSPMDMEFKLVEIPHQFYISLLEYTTSWGFERPHPHGNLSQVKFFKRFSVEEYGLKA